MGLKTVEFKQTDLPAALSKALGRFRAVSYLSGILAIVVCHDAMGVRLETGKQAVILNEVVELYNILSKEKLPEVKLKEFVGHTPMQVLFGVLLGIVNALLMYNFIFK